MTRGSHKKREQREMIDYNEIYPDSVGFERLMDNKEHELSKLSQDQWDPWPEQKPALKRERADWKKYLDNLDKWIITTKEALKPKYKRKITRINLTTGLKKYNYRSIIGWPLQTNLGFKFHVNKIIIGMAAAHSNYSLINVKSYKATKYIWIGVFPDLEYVLYVIGTAAAHSNYSLTNVKIDKELLFRWTGSVRDELLTPEFIKTKWNWDPEETKKESTSKKPDSIICELCGKKFNYGDTICTAGPNDCLNIECSGYCRPGIRYLRKVKKTKYKKYCPVCHAQLSKDQRYNKKIAADHTKEPIYYKGELTAKTGVKGLNVNNAGLYVHARETDLFNTFSSFYFDNTHNKEDAETLNGYKHKVFEPIYRPGRPGHYKTLWKYPDGPNKGEYRIFRLPPYRKYDPIIKKYHAKIGPVTDKTVIKVRIKLPTFPVLKYKMESPEEIKYPDSKRDETPKMIKTDWLQRDQTEIIEDHYYYNVIHCMEHDSNDCFGVRCYPNEPYQTDLKRFSRPPKYPGGYMDKIDLKELEEQDQTKIVNDRIDWHRKHDNNNNGQFRYFGTYAYYDKDLKNSGFRLPGKKTSQIKNSIKINFPEHYPTPADYQKYIETLDKLKYFNYMAFERTVIQFTNGAILIWQTRKRIDKMDKNDVLSFETFRKKVSMLAPNI